ncbi:hypothetical protein JJL45_03655 [Tamlana sp. s12]|nr:MULTISPECIES: hypothetical protein [Tamlana]QQY83101.1 hypothetical protein JJL45_03655 [Tamlana sp. s12]
MPEKLEKFQFEELEQRFEMGWGPKKVHAKGTIDGKPVEVKSLKKK